MENPDQSQKCSEPYHAALKVNVVVEAIEGQQTIAETASENRKLPVQNVTKRGVSSRRYQYTFKMEEERGPSFGVFQSKLYKHIDQLNLILLFFTQFAVERLF